MYQATKAGNIVVMTKNTCYFTGVYKPKTEDRKMKTLFYARQGTDRQKTKPKGSSAQTDAKITGASFCRKDLLNLQNEDPR